jgi:hypothetical protein
MEILQGSNSVGMSNWTQKINGKLGKVSGANELEKTIIQLERASNKFDMAALLLEITMVIGALGVLIRNETTKCIYLCMMLSLGIAGAILFSVGLYLVMLL